MTASATAKARRFPAPFRWSSVSVAMAALGLAVTAAILCVLVVFDARPDAPGGVAEQNRAICDDAARRLLAADTGVELERARYLLEAMGCAVQPRLRDLRPAARAIRGE